jgi:hypothetical protein
VREFRSLGSVRGAVSNDRPYRELPSNLILLHIWTACGSLVGRLWSF